MIKTIMGISIVTHSKVVMYVASDIPDTVLRTPNSGSYNK